MAKNNVKEAAIVTIGERDIPGFLDMLRYDGATVAGWFRGDPGWYGVEIRSRAGSHLTPDRWASFGIMYTPDGDRV